MFIALESGGDLRISAAINFVSEICLVLASVISFIKAKVYHYFINRKVVKIFIKQLYMCWYYFYSPNMKYLTYTLWRL